METDAALRLLGKYGKWQIRTYLMYAFGFGIPFAWILMSVVFIVDQPAHRCNIPEGALVNESVPMEMQYGYPAPSQCSMYVNFSISNETMPCNDGWWYDPASGYDETIVSSWDLVCSRAWLAELMMSITTIGTILGTLFFTKLSDAIGRKPVFVACTWSYVVVGVIHALSPSYIFFTIVGVLEGFFQQGMITSVAILCVELFPTEQRTFAGIFIQFFWVIGYITLSPIAYYFRHWRHLMLAITCPLVLTIIFYWTTFESIPWLVANGRKHEANGLMKKAAKTNGVKIPDEVFDAEGESNVAEKRSWKERIDSAWQKFKHPTTDQDEKYQVPFSTFFTHPRLRTITVVNVFLWFVNNFVYSGLSLTVTMLAGNRYLNFFLYGLVEIPAYLIAWVLLLKLGRKPSLAIFHIIAGVSLLTTVILNTEMCKDKDWLKILLYMVGKFGISASFGSIYVATPEAFPTNVRNTAFGFCMFATRVTQFITPFIRVWYRYDSYSPPLAMGALAILGAFTVYFLPETRWEPLPETLLDLDTLGQRKRPAAGVQKNANMVNGNQEEIANLVKQKEVDC